MDIVFILKYIPMYITATKLTVGIAFWGILLSLLIGFICSIILYYRIKVLSLLVNMYIELSRNTPLLIQLFFLYYGVTRIGIKLEALTCAVIGMAFLGGSYMAEAFRSGLESVNKAQIEAGISIGLNNIQLIRYAILPQAFAVSIPAIAANAIFLLKETSVFSAIALADLMFVAKDLIGMYYKTNEALTMLVLSYLLILLPMSALFTLLEKRMRHAWFGN